MAYMGGAIRAQLPPPYPRPFQNNILAPSTPIPEIPVHDPGWKAVV